MGSGVVLDTSYLITLAGPDRPNHGTARRYWRHFIDSQMPAFLPTIVVSEFYVRQEIPADILRCCVVLPFNWDDARKAAELGFDQIKAAAGPRDALKDDVKIIAQAVVCGAAFLITDDVRTMYPSVNSLRAAGRLQLVPIRLDGGFDRAVFDNGQGCFSRLLDETDAEDDA